MHFVFPRVLLTTPSWLVKIDIMHEEHGVLAGEGAPSSVPVLLT